MFCHTGCGRSRARTISARLSPNSSPPCYQSSSRRCVLSRPLCRREWSSRSSTRDSNRHGHFPSPRPFHSVHPGRHCLSSLMERRGPPCPKEKREREREREETLHRQWRPPLVAARRRFELLSFRFPMANAVTLASSTRGGREGIRDGRSKWKKRLGHSRCYSAVIPAPRIYPPSRRGSHVTSCEYHSLIGCFFIGALASTFSVLHHRRKL